MNGDHWGCAMQDKWVFDPDEEPARAPDRALEWDAELSRRACCPLCQYDLRAYPSTWSDRCPVFGLCPECGRRFRWGKVLAKSKPRAHAPPHPIGLALLGTTGAIVACYALLNILFAPVGVGVNLLVAAAGFAVLLIATGVTGITPTSSGSDH